MAVDSQRWHVEMNSGCCSLILLLALSTAVLFCFFLKNFQNCIFCTPFTSETSLSVFLSLCYQTFFLLASPHRLVKCLGGNQSALNIKYAVKRQKSLHADDDGESRAVREEVWMERRRRRRMDTDMQRWRERQMEVETLKKLRDGHKSTWIITCIGFGNHLNWCIRC